MFIKPKSLFALILGMSLSSQAGRIQSYCFMDEATKKVIGHNIDEKLPLASVSKVLTSLAVLSTFGARTKLYTEFFVSPVGKDIYDVHIKGSRDPYFARASMHTLISRLNEIGVRKIRTLTFDEKFKYLHNTDQLNRPLCNRANKSFCGRFYNPVTGKAPIDAPAGEFVRALLLDNKQVMLDYEKSRKEAAKSQVFLVAKPQFNPQKIELVRSTFVPPANAKKGFVSSMELIDIVKNMNWNSNNHVANALFMIAGGKQKVEELYFNKFKFNPSEISFENGSGQNGNLAGNGRAYTEASCAATARVVYLLKKTLEAQKMKLEDTVAVNGGDIGSTVDSAVYKRQYVVEYDKSTKEQIVRRSKNQRAATLKVGLPAKTIIAKTGTVGVAITLAGVMSTGQGNQIFMVNVEPRQMRSERSRENEAAKCRTTIGGVVAFKMAQLGGGRPIAYTNRYRDVVNFEDTGDADSPEVAEEAPEVGDLENPNPSTIAETSTVAVSAVAPVEQKSKLIENPKTKTAAKPLQKREKPKVAAAEQPKSATTEDAAAIKNLLDSTPEMKKPEANVQQQAKDLMNSYGEI